MRIFLTHVFWQYTTAAGNTLGDALICIRGVARDQVKHRKGRKMTDNDYDDVVATFGNEFKGVCAYRMYVCVCTVCLCVPLLITSPCTSPCGRVRVVQTSVLPRPTPVVSSIPTALVRRCALTCAPHVPHNDRPPGVTLCSRALPARACTPGVRSCLSFRMCSCVPYVCVCRMCVCTVCACECVCVCV